ncbi:uncharacterized protein N7483_002730 [Penicillium malachiteum]|uniref:uncharacterized protein n=1 Tax=Penicillium malachiteum TaxID=1324776 RepID=UPI0025470071|nr:uncharacterized protein N7483_002730 [Penicillium malachiteum]KAJ5737605.1 hypothetical protein N7483_002730 [Penicillium malachiteum]
MEPQITQNIFCTYAGPQDEVDTTIFFISGNPGLIGYYHPFLSLLAQNLAEKEPESDKNQSQSPNKTSFQINGCSLGGFEIPSGSAKAEKRLYSLEDQIRFVHQKLEALMHKTKSVSSSQESESDENESSSRARRHKVILIGHSVGAYIAIEVLRRHRDGIPSLEGIPEAESKSELEASRVFDIVGGVMLFPTVKDIAHSPSGQKLTTLLYFIPQLALLVGYFATILTALLPSTFLKFVIRSVMKNPPPHGLETTCTFLKSSGGVRQALHMAADEMRTITSDKWADDVWGVGHTSEPMTRLFFYFGRNDHWVAEKTRDEIIALRGQEGDKGTGEWLGPKMTVCEEGLPHAFCLLHSGIMAGKVANMIRDIMSG